ncbi:acetyl-CoA C-acyltransferase [Rhodovulum sulfidophilum]|uniref:acetyl-CoA C-acyltransferase n=1 Tax=Rhodovulum sulfidophilum TaxID=35806 RepID=UPI001927E4DF|nr:acetyl-CoA C-acyltransferase [Rhodovulum sulfidophilum]MBL3586792.1 acetyl-CoA C-acyltransferase [Rhodovulum sulfidophilum]
MQDIYILGAARTPIGSFGGALSSLGPDALGRIAAEAAIARAEVSARMIDNAVAGNVIPTQPRDMYLARAVAMGAGMPATSQALTLNRLCGSGAQAIATAATMIRAGESRLALAFGAEAMSRAPHTVGGMRDGVKMGDASVTDWLTGALSDPFDIGHMGVTAENVAGLHGITRQEQDAFAAESQRRAGIAIDEGRFDAQICPVTIKGRRGDTVVSQDEYPKPGTDAARLAGLRPAFRKDGTVTAGNASGINDGAAALVLAGEDAARAAHPIARLLSWSVAGVPPEVMGLGPVEAVPLALSRAGLSLADIDVIESNEAFAAQAIAVNRLLGLDPEKVNPNGGAIALGHPLGATGAILAVKAIHELQRIAGRYALVTMCIGGGQGIALVIERLEDTA